jgi:hypothetical protein
MILGKIEFYTTKCDYSCTPKETDGTVPHETEHIPELWP